jgi:hypothetical protein
MDRIASRALIAAALPPMMTYRILISFLRFRENPKFEYRAKHPSLTNPKQILNRKWSKFQNESFRKFDEVIKTPKSPKVRHSGESRNPVISNH